MALPRLESFAGSAGVLDGTWTQQRTSGTINYDGSGNAVTNSGDVDAFAFDNSNVYPDNQYAILTIGVNGFGVGDRVGVLTRASLTGDANYKNYCFYTDGASGAGHTAFGRITADVLTELTSFATTFAASDVMELRSTGSLHECFKNGSSLGTFTDSTHVSGSAGLEIQDTSGGTIMTVGSWEGGALIAQSVAVSGTATAGIEESVIVTGGQTIILTLTGDTWITAT